MAARTGTYRIRFVVDGVAATAPATLAVENNDPDDSRRCAVLSTTAAADALPNVVAANQPLPDVGLQAMNSHLRPLANITVQAGTIKPLGQPLPGPDILGYIRENCERFSKQTDRNGLATFDDMSFFGDSYTTLYRFTGADLMSTCTPSPAFPGCYAFLATCEDDVVPETECASTFAPLTMTNPIASIEVQTQPGGCIVGKSWDTQPEIIVKDKNGAPLANTEMHMGFVLVDFPVYLNNKGVPYPPAGGPTGSVIDGDCSPKTISGPNTQCDAADTAGVIDNAGITVTSDANGMAKWTDAGMVAGSPGHYAFAPYVNGILGPEMSIDCYGTAADEKDAAVSMQITGFTINGANALDLGGKVTSTDVLGPELTLTYGASNTPLQGYRVLALPWNGDHRAWFSGEPDLRTALKTNSALRLFTDAEYNGGVWSEARQILHRTFVD